MTLYDGLLFFLKCFFAGKLCVLGFTGFVLQVVRLNSPPFVCVTAGLFIVLCLNISVCYGSRKTGLDLG